MSHVIELPDHIYRAIERYATQRGQSPEAAILAWGKAIEEAVSTEAQSAGEAPPALDVSRVDNPQFDPWAGLHGAITSED